jgi:hypothetical protein
MISAIGSGDTAWHDPEFAVTSIGRYVKARPEGWWTYPLDGHTIVKSYYHTSREYDSIFSITNGKDTSIRVIEYSKNKAVRLVECAKGEPRRDAVVKRGVQRVTTRYEGNYEVRTQPAYKVLAPYEVKTYRSTGELITTETFTPQGGLLERFPPSQ